jgi:hypothetical protein
MPAKAKEMLKFFRGRRIAILLVAAGVALFFALGGHQRLLGLAVNQMAGFLLGTGDVAEEELAAGDATRVNDVPGQPSPRALLTGEAILSQVGATDALAAPASDEPRQDDTRLAQAPADSAGQEGQAAVSSSAGRRTIQAYSAGFLRDPFDPLIAKGRGKLTQLLDVGNARMVGSVWGESGIIALLEDDSDRSYALKVGDSVVNGRVVSITPASITFSITIFGLTRTITLELAEEGER